MNEIYKKVFNGGKKEELNSGYNYHSSTKNSNHYRGRRNLPSSKINSNRIDNITNNSIISNKKIRPFSSSKDLNQKNN